MQSKSPLQQARLHYQPRLPASLQNLKTASFVKTLGGMPGFVSPQIADLFPLTHESPSLQCVNGQVGEHHPKRVGIVLSGGQAPGGHNVISGLYDALKTLNPASTLIGFLDGPGGIVNDRTIEITESLLAGYRNQGGFDLIGSGRTKIETPAQFEAAEASMRKHQLDGLVVVGGDDSNTNAALLAEYFSAHKCSTVVVGVPKTIDGDLKSEAIEISFGFDTASKNYSGTIGSIMSDALSAKKYYYFIKLMGRSASHITLECALQTHPNLVFISEEVAEKKQTLKDLIDAICDLICQRASKGKNYGVILLPEGMVEFIPEMKRLIEELNSLLAAEKLHHAALEKLNSNEEKVGYVEKLLSKEALSCFQTLPKENQSQLFIGRDSHGNVQVSKIETERMMIELVEAELKKRSEKEGYKGLFSAVPHFCGYEGRSCLPSNFDSHYCYALGHAAALLIDAKANGYIACMKNLCKPVEEWIPGGISLTALMTIEERHGKNKPVIRKALVDLNGKPFALFQQHRSEWTQEDDYVNPGPVQFFGPQEISDRITLTLTLEHV